MTFRFSRIRQTARSTTRRVCRASIGPMITDAASRALAQCTVDPFKFRHRRCGHDVRCVEHARNIFTVLKRALVRAAAVRARVHAPSSRPGDASSRLSGSY
ncbi:hypothetical protein EVAR_95342_1 [Eumeta japonica]|uniref:Uncharacterized protein n=1 Tax=Eumeta variegata TaxID=151549 RepID=A0A4C1U984_EUMVA|nr:hypothetical protein EVAR_95342_1 [Eumeta japonica]